MAFILRGYSTALNKWPVIVQAVQAGALMGVGDVLAQTLVEKQQVTKLDWRRTLQFSAVGLILIGGPLRVWYGVLDKLVITTGRTAALKKTAVDQLCFAPIFLTVIMSGIGIAQGHSFEDIKLRIQRDYSDVLLANYKIWPGVQLANFYLVPLRHQVLTVQVVAVFWNTYLSWKTNTALDSENYQEQF